ncbi:MAG: hypothetical protein ACYC5M_07030 [Anaerolineae bacterium]
MIHMRALVLAEQLSMDLAEGRSFSERINAFGPLARVTSLFSKPQPEDIQLVHRERRYEPFWHVVCSTTASYRRRRQYHVVIKKPEVRMVSIEGKDYPVSEGQITQEGIEYCETQARQELFVDGQTAKPQPNLANYLRYPATVIETNDLNGFAPEGSLVLPPITSASTLVRDILAGMVQTVDADEILDEMVTVERVDLYWRPIYAFSFVWGPRNREGVLECDALSGEFRGGGSIHPEAQLEPLYAGAVLDINPGMLAQFVPGGHIAVPAAQKQAAEHAEPLAQEPEIEPAVLVRPEVDELPEAPVQPEVPPQEEIGQSPLPTDLP